MDADFESRLNAMLAASDGAIWVESGDRDTATQQRLWDEAVAKYGPDEARNWAAPPGHSNHEKGIAVDLGGDLDLAAKLAPQFGLYAPMSWEPWHYEPIGSRTDDPLAYTERSTDPSALVGGRKKSEPSWADALTNLLGIRPFSPGSNIPELATQRLGADSLVAGNPAFAPPTAADQLPTAGPAVTVPGRTGRNGTDIPETDLDRFMAALRMVESSGNYKAIGTPTPWGTAKGAYQYLDSTWDNYKGYPTAADAPPEIQDEKARLDMQRYYNEYGSWDNVAAAWYSGPGGNWASPEVQTYVHKVRSEL